jgi:membrane protease YdiL (CAAX protease family)
MDEFQNNPGSENNEEKHHTDDQWNSDHEPRKNELENIHPLISPIAAAFIGLIGWFFLYQVVGGIITILIFGMDIKNAPVNEVRLITTGGQILFILLPALVFSKWIYENVSVILRIKIPHWKEISLFIIGIIILIPLLQNFLYIQNFTVDYLAKISPLAHNIKSFLDSWNDLVENTYGNLLETKNIFEGLFVVIVVSMVPALCEESMFRGFIQRSFEFKLKPFWAALITAVFFGASHLNPYGLIPLIGLGLYFGFAAYTSNSIFVPMSLHFLNNFTAVILYFIFGNDELINSPAVSSADLRASVLYFVLLSILFAGIIILIKKFYSETKSRPIID